MDYNFRKIEQKWQQYWKDNKTYKVETDTDKPKFYILDMFPYPSGAGLHVGHPLGYIASDIYSRYKRLNGFNVLHPMGYDAFGLPAEQYAIQTGQHPAKTTENNINRYREQLDKIGFSYDWSREIRTCDPSYYKWTQWAFVQMFEHWYNKKSNKAEPIATLLTEFENNGNLNIQAATTCEVKFGAPVWRGLSEEEQLDILMQYRLAFRADAMVNWCPALGTVLANDEVKEGVSVRGSHPVEQKKMSQWFLRVSAYAERLLNGLDEINWSESLKEIQRNWIGRSEGAEVFFAVKDSDVKIQIFTTRPDTIFGATFMVLAPESDYVDQVTNDFYRGKIETYINETKARTERERISDVRSVTGQFTGSYAINPFTNAEIPIYISDYVLAGYGTGAIMAVPAHDSRDFAFANEFGLQIIRVIDCEAAKKTDDSYDSKEGVMINSGILNGLEVLDAIKRINDEIEARGIGKRKINFRLRDAIFSRQRYWGEPFPIYYKNGIPYTLDTDKLPLELPPVDSFLPTQTGEPPLARAQKWETADGYRFEYSTMPGFAGSSAYYLRYMDPQNDNELVSKQANEYWRDVDLYIGGIEHATGHLIYSRFWNKFLFDIGKVCEQEPFKKLVNQGMIQGRSNFVYRVVGTNKFVSLGLKDQYKTSEIHVDVNLVRNDILDTDAFREWIPEYANAEFVLENGKYICGWAVEKMSKSMFNVVNPDVIIESYGADTLRLYEMFLGPLEQSKPWDTNGIEGTHKFLRKVWRLFHNAKNEFEISNDEPTFEELKVLHKTIKKIKEDIERFAFNTSISAFMICVNELNELKCTKRAILEDLLVLLSPFAPHICEELWQLCGHTNTVVDAVFPLFDNQYLIEDTIKYPISFNGKTRLQMDIPADYSAKQIEELVLNSDMIAKWLDGKAIKKVIVVPNKIVNIVFK